MGLDTKTYWLTDRQSQCDFDFDFDLSVQFLSECGGMQLAVRFPSVNMWRCQEWNIGV
jgi:hypothetical protein